MPLRSSMQQEREVQILKVAESLMARHGIENLTFTLLAGSVSMGRATLRHLFADLDEILARILRDHLRRIFKALGTIPHDAPDRRRLQRELYVQETHHPFGGLPTPIYCSHAIVICCRRTCCPPSSKPASA